MFRSHKNKLEEETMEEKTIKISEELNEDLKPDTILKELSCDFNVENEMDEQVLGNSLVCYLEEIGEKLKIKNIEDQKIYFLRKNNHLEIGFVRIELIK